MKRRNSKSNIMRALLIVGATLSVVGGVTFALLKSQDGVVKGNTIQTAIASLQVSTNNTTYSNSVDGFAFTGLIPGGGLFPSGGNAIFVRNVGTTTLGLKLSVGSQLINTDNLDLNKVFVVITPMGGGAGQKISLQELVSSAATGGVALTINSRLISNQTIGYTLQVSLDADAVTGPSASISNVDFNFGGAATS